MQTVTLKFEEDKREFVLPIPEGHRCFRNTGTHGWVYTAPYYSLWLNTLGSYLGEGNPIRLRCAWNMARDACLWFLRKVEDLDCNNAPDDVIALHEKASFAWEGFEEFLEEKIDEHQNR